MNYDGPHKKLITAPQNLDYSFPDGNKINFSSKLHDPKRIDFDLYSIRDDGSDPERITFFNGFDGFPILSPNGNYTMLASNRNQKKRGSINLFFARMEL